MTHSPFAQIDVALKFTMSSGLTGTCRFPVMSETNLSFGTISTGRNPRGSRCQKVPFGSVLVNNIFYRYTVWVQIQALERIVYTSRFWVYFENPQNCKQIIGTPRRSIFHAAKSSQMAYRANIYKECNLDYKI